MIYNILKILKFYWFYFPILNSFFLSLIKIVFYFLLREFFLCSSEPDWNTLMEVHYEPIEKNYELLEEIGK